MDFKIDANVSKNVTDLADKPIHNLVDKPSEAIGNGLASIFNLVFAPVEYLNQKAQLACQHKIEKKQLSYNQSIEKYKQELENKVCEIPPENLVEPDFHTAHLALVNSKSCITDDELRKMFVNLISSSMDSSTKSSVHPAFASIINQMSVLDAKILMTFKFSERYPILDLREKSGQVGYKPFMTNLFLYIVLNKDDYIDFDLMQVSSSISNLDRLGLIEVDYLQHLTDKRQYNDLEKEANKLYESHSIAADNRDMQKGIVFLTPLGKDFIKVCLSD